MKKLALLSSLLILTFLANAINAAVLIKMRDARHKTTSIYIKDNKAHFEMPDNAGYIVMDVANRTIKAVIHQQRMIMDMSEFLNANGSPPPGKYIDTYTKTMGLGPTIVGYETEEYGLYANDKYCGSMYVSVNAMRDLGVTKFARAFLDLERNMDAKISAMTGMRPDQFLDPCEESRRKAGLKLREMGFPLKNTNKNKQLESIVTLVNKKARLPANAFVIPADYTVTNPSKMMNDTMKQMNINPSQMQQMMKSMTPEMRRMIQQQMQH